MQTKSGFILPVVAIFLTFMAMSYSACHDSKAESRPSSGAIELKDEISRFEKELGELKKINDSHVQEYSEEMGCTANSKALEIIKHHNELIETLTKRLEYHKLQFIQADTANQQRNKAEMTELKNDFKELETDGQQIKTGLVAFPPTHVTK
jgi:hypothetical protein